MLDFTVKTITCKLPANQLYKDCLGDQQSMLAEYVLVAGCA